MPESCRRPAFSNIWLLSLIDSSQLASWQCGRIQNSRVWWLLWRILGRKLHEMKNRMILTHSWYYGFLAFLILHKWLLGNLAGWKPVVDEGFFDLFLILWLLGLLDSSQMASWQCERMKNSGVWRLLWRIKPIWLCHLFFKWHTHNTSWKINSIA